MRAAVLAVFLGLSVTTLWMPPRLNTSIVEAGAFGLTALAITRAGVRLPAIALVPVCVALWAGVQLAIRWTAVPAVTADACLYWAGAACLIALGTVVERERFLTYFLAIGGVICVAGVIQLFTSRGAVFWLFRSGYDRQVMGPFVSANNYAAFVELLTPVALTRRSRFRLPATAGLAASVIASGSRAGAILVASEIAVILGAQRKWRNLTQITGLVVGFALVVGPQFLYARFQQPDAFAVRRELLSSTSTMFRTEPWHGFGMGTWPWVYPQFALIDTGEVANHAHNEWAQWAAEGGIPVLAGMLVLAVWSGWSAKRHFWALGVIAVFCHSLVDYPFLRIGLAAWIFVLIGAASSQFVWPVRGLRVLLATALVGAAFCAVREGYAEALYCLGTPAAAARAVNVADRGEYRLALAQWKPGSAARELKAALTLNPRYTEARIALSQEYEAAGNLGAAEAELLEAARLDRQFIPAWALANFYFRQDAADRFWTWARRAAAVSFGDRRSLFDLCFLVESDSGAVFDRIGGPALEPSFLRYLVRRRGAVGARDFARRAALSLSSGSTPARREALLEYVDRAIEAGDSKAAWPVWLRLGNPAAGRGFDWSAVETNGVSVIRQRQAWRVELSGLEPEKCDLLTRFLPGGAFRFRFEYRTEGFGSPAGLAWNGIALDAAPAWRSVEVPVRGDRLLLQYSRPIGAIRVEGILWLRNPELFPISPPLTFRPVSADKRTECCG